MFWTTVGVLSHGVQTVSVRSPALPHARITPTCPADGLSMLYIMVRHSVSPLGMVVSPSFDPVLQVWPPSYERSSQVSSVGEPLEISAQAMSSGSSMCRTMLRDHTDTVAAVRLLAARLGSRTSG